ncbi:MAG: hypothetical protein JW797_04625 [Bradymonadales bacterium]|nr:hypothetical protein [Bradymonadales bacterium]
MWVVTLDSREGFEEIEVVGGKAHGLHRLLQAGFRVPKGYVVTTDAYRQALRRPLFGLDRPEEMVRAVLSCEIPVEIERAVHDVQETMFDSRPVSVRSSATAEDTEQHSYAGQLKSVLNVSGTEAVLQAVKEVWASSFEYNHLLYRGRIRLDTSPSHVAVVVQQMLTPRMAGVMFTADPVGGFADHIVISATAGLGEAVVAGHSSETVYVDLSNGHVLEHIPASPQGERVLSEEDIELLVQAAARVNREFSAPQDLEWALDERGLAFLQCRPITAGRHRPGFAHKAVWSNVNVGEALPGVATPMTWSIIWSFARRGFDHAFGALGLTVPPDFELVASFRGRVYLNLTQFASIASQVPFLSVKNLLAVGGGGGVEELDRIGFERRSRRGFLTRLPLTMARMAWSQLATPQQARNWAGRLRRKRDELLASDLTGLTPVGLLSVLREIDRIFDRTGIVMLSCGSNFLSSYIVTRELLRLWGGEDAASKEQHLFSGLRGLASAEPGLQLLDMARFVDQHPSLAQVFKQLPSGQIVDQLAQTTQGRMLLEKYQSFLRSYGTRASREAEISTPRWREEPEFLFEVIKRHLESPYLPSREDLEQERETVRKETTQMIRRHFPTGLGLIFRLILRWTQQNARLREELRACVVDTLALYRHLFLEVGRRLSEARLVSRVEDVFFLTKEEVVRFLQRGLVTTDLSLIVATRRAGLVAFRETGELPDTFVLDVDGGIQQTRQRVPSDTPFLQGLAASPGRVTGRARVVVQLEAHSDVHPGEILVAPFTDVGWTPLFLIASGVVTDMGGPLSHAAVVAREYGIPAVVNAKEATVLIKNGDLVTLDGSSGRVYLQR